MPEFTQSWAFAFIIGCFIGGCFGFLLAAILAASGRASRMEEKIVRDGRLDTQFIKLLEEAKRLDIGDTEFIERTLKKYKLIPKIKIATKNDPRTD